MQKIVLVENTGLVRIKFEKTLSSYGYSEITTMSGDDIYNSHMETFFKNAQVVFIDDDNRDNDTKKIITTIRSHYMSNAYIVIMSSKPNISEIQKFMAYGCNDILAKPYSDVRLMEKILNASTAPSMSTITSTQKSTHEEPDRYMPEWHEDLELGLETIDNEHRELIESYETLYQRMKVGMGYDYCIELLNYLKDYVTTHFQNEELFLEKINYPNLDNHRELHSSFKEEVLHIANKLENQEIDNQTLIRFNLFVKNWWLYHILIEDKDYMTFYKNNQ